VTILSEGDYSEPFPLLSRDQMRLDRQARVGILRNPKEPPRLPPRKAALTGKWLDLRSRRRLRRQGPEPVSFAAVAEAVPDTPVSRSDAGRMSRIDVARLMAEVELREAARPARKPFAQGYRGGAESQAAQSEEVAERLRENLRELAVEAERAAAEEAPSDAPEDAVEIAEAEHDAVAMQLPAVPSDNRSALRRALPLIAGILAGLAAAGLLAHAATWLLALPG